MNRLSFDRKLLGVFAGVSLLSFAVVAAEAAPVAAHPKFSRQSVGAGVHRQFAKQVGNAVIVNAASYLPGISPGGLVTIFGQNLSSVNDIEVPGTDPLPTTFAGVSVLINGIYAPIFSVAYANGEDQISVQVPYETATGPSAAEVQVYNNGNLVADFLTDSYVEDPGIFLYGNNYAVAVNAADYSLIGPNNPAYPGEIITLYTTGLGPLTLNLQDGVGAPYNPLAYTQDPFQVLIAGQQANVLFSGLAPGFVGLYQLNIQLPNNLPAGNLDLQIYTSYANSGIATLPVN